MRRPPIYFTYAAHSLKGLTKQELEAKVKNQLNTKRANKRNKAMAKRETGETKAAAIDEIMKKLAEDEK